MWPFGKPDPTALVALDEFLRDEWTMRDRFRKAFISAYMVPLAKAGVRVQKALQRMRATPGGALEAIAGEAEAYAGVLVAAAYQGYMGDLRRGRHVGTDVELAIWAILSNRSDILEEHDPAFARYIDAKADEKFPQLFEFVFEVSTQT